MVSYSIAHRLEKYQLIVDTNLASKWFIFAAAKIQLKKTIFIAGLYKPASIRTEHGLMLNALAGALSLSKSQLHGKRQKRTSSVEVRFPENKAWAAIDKVVHELLPRINDFQSPKFKKPATQSYSLRLNQKFNPLVDFEDLVDSEMFDTHKGVFLPLTLHFSLVAYNNCNNAGQHYLRMLRLPLTFYRKHAAPAFDDPVTFTQ